MSTSIKVAAVLFWITAVGFGLPNLPAIRNMLLRGEVPLLFGFPAYGGGYFERFGIKTSVPLLSAFLLVCVLEGAAGWLLWGGCGRRGGRDLPCAGYARRLAGRGFSRCPSVIVRSGGGIHQHQARHAVRMANRVLHG